MIPTACHPTGFQFSRGTSFASAFKPFIRRSPLTHICLARIIHEGAAERKDSGASCRAGLGIFAAEG